MTMTNATILKRPALTLPDCLLELLLMQRAQCWSWSWSWRRRRWWCSAQSDKQTGKRTGRQTNRETGRETDRRTGQRRTCMADDGYVASLPDSRQKDRQREREGEMKQSGRGRGSRPDSVSCYWNNEFLVMRIDLSIDDLLFSVFSLQYLLSASLVHLPYFLPCSTSGYHSTCSLAVSLIPLLSYWELYIIWLIV